MDALLLARMQFTANGLWLSACSASGVIRSGHRENSPEGMGATAATVVAGLRDRLERKPRAVGAEGRDMARLRRPA